MPKYLLDYIESVRGKCGCCTSKDENDIDGGVVVDPVDESQR